MSYYCFALKISTPQYCSTHHNMQQLAKVITGDSELDREELDVELAGEGLGLIK